MQVPVRLVTLLRPDVATSVLASVGVATFVFSATPFVLKSVPELYGVGLGLAALVSTTQLAGFAIAAYASRRVLAGRSHVFLGALVALVLANAVSALLPSFWLLMTARFVAGLAMGVASWVAWGLAFGTKKGTSDVAMVGPLLGVISAPILAPVFAWGGVRAVYGLLAVVALVPILLGPSVALPRTKVEGVDGHSRPAPAAAAMLGALAMFTLGGSAVWVFTGVFAQDRGLPLNVLAFSYSANAMAGLVGSRWTGSRGPAGFWMALTGGAAFVVSSIDLGWTQVVASIIWGFGFWMAMPAAFDLLAARSRFPEERAGDAQSMMAIGRVIGPTVGGVLLDLGGGRALGWFALAAMALAGAVVVVIQNPSTGPVGRASPDRST